MASAMVVFSVVAVIVGIVVLNSLRVIAWNTATIASELAQIKEAVKLVAEKLPDSN